MTPLSSWSSTLGTKADSAILPSSSSWLSSLLSVFACLFLEALVFLLLAPAFPSLLPSEGMFTFSSTSSSLEPPPTPSFPPFPSFLSIKASSVFFLCALVFSWPTFSYPVFLDASFSSSITSSTPPSSPPSPPPSFPWSLLSASFLLCALVFRPLSSTCSSDSLPFATLFLCFPVFSSAGFSWFSASTSPLLSSRTSTFSSVFSFLPFTGSFCCCLVFGTLLLPFPRFCSSFSWSPSSEKTALDLPSFFELFDSFCVCTLVPGILLARRFPFFTTPSLSTSKASVSATFEFSTLFFRPLVTLLCPALELNNSVPSSTSPALSTSTLSMHTSLLSSWPSIVDSSTFSCLPFAAFCLASCFLPLDDLFWFLFSFDGLPSTTSPPFFLLCGPFSCPCTFFCFPLVALCLILTLTPFFLTGILDFLTLGTWASFTSGWLSEQDPNSGDIVLCFVPSRTKLSLITKLSASAATGDLSTTVLFKYCVVSPIVRKVSSSSIPSTSMTSSSSSDVSRCFWFCLAFVALLFSVFSLGLVAVWGWSLETTADGDSISTSTASFSESLFPVFPFLTAVQFTSYSPLLIWRQREQNTYKLKNTPD